MEIATEVDVGHWFAMTGSDGPLNSQFIEPQTDTERYPKAERLQTTLVTTWPPALRANSNFNCLLCKSDMHIKTDTNLGKDRI